MAAPAKTILVTRSAINADAMAWTAKPSADSGVYMVDIRPLLKAEKISVGSFVVMPITGLCVSTSSSIDGLLVLTISGGDGQVYKLQFVFADTGGHIEVFQVSLPVSAGTGCVMPMSTKGAVGQRGPVGATGPAGARGLGGPPGLLDGPNILPLPGGLARGDELLIYRPGAGFYFISAAVLDPTAVVFEDIDTSFGGVPLKYGTPAAFDIVFNGAGVVAGNAVTTFTAAPAVAPVIFGLQPVLASGQPTAFTAAPVLAAVTFNALPVFANGQPTAFNPTPVVSDVLFATVPALFAAQPLAYTGATKALVFVTQPVAMSGQNTIFV